MRTIIALGHNLGLKVVAEGVETADRLQFLREHACDEVQGYYFSRPLPPQQFALLLRREADGLEEADDLAGLIHVDGDGRGHLRQSRHGHDVPADHDDELGAGGQPHFADR